MIQRYLMEQLNLNEYRAKVEYENLHRHADIEQEFANYILGKEGRILYQSRRIYRKGFA